MAPADSQGLDNQNPVGSPIEVSQNTIASIISSQTPFKAVGVHDSLHVWKSITSDPFILDAVTHCHVEFEWEPEACASVNRPFYSLTGAEQAIIDNEEEKCLLKGQKEELFLDLDADFHSLTAKSAGSLRHRQRKEFARTDSRDLRAVHSGIKLVIEWNKG